MSVPICIFLHFALFAQSWQEAARPSFVQDLIKSLKLAIFSINGKRSVFVLTSDAIEGALHQTVALLNRFLYLDAHGMIV